MSDTANTPDSAGRRRWGWAWLTVAICLVAAVALLSSDSGGGTPSPGGQLRKIHDCFRQLPRADADAMIHRCARRGLR